MIKFGTDGWRAVIAKEFTFENVAIVTQALIDYLNSQNLKNRTLAVGYDCRFLSERFAKEVAIQLAANNFQVSLFDDAVPTPMVSFEVRAQEMAAGVVITASHNPPEFNGFKVKAPFGGSAPPEITKQIEILLNKSTVITTSFDEAVKVGKIKAIQPSINYGRHLAKLVDLERIKASSSHLVVDPMHGSGARWVEHLLNGGKCRVTTIRANRDPYFGGVSPEPIANNLLPLFEAVRKHSALLGLATDGDADRVGACDELGNFISSHQIVAILLLHLAKERSLRGAVAITFSQSTLVKRIAKHYGLTIYETPIGFKYLAELMLSQDILISGEESGGIGIKGHIPERDGILNSLLLAEAIITSQKTPSKLLETIWQEFGRFYYDRLDLHIDIEKGKAFVENIKSFPPSSFAGEEIESIETLDGTKLIFTDGSWLLFRQSGTEPVLRLYCEATSQKKLEKILTKAKELAISN
ncbi:MAG: phosphoglucomutase/phosphomannomutase family protein [Acidobacteria bacterium]|nr:phosphoglucomutase/phosphomannomutase family protein [Acidobacteriota bacterium]